MLQKKIGHKAKAQQIFLEKEDSKTKQKRVFLGIALAIIATLIFATQDTVTKTLVHYYPATFFVMVRYWAFFLAGLYMVKTADGGLKANIKSNRPFIQCLRGVLLMCELVLFAMALGHLGLADVTAIFQSYPLFGTILAIFLLKEQVGWRRIVALFIGFAGILIMIRPGFGVFSYGSAFAILAAFLFALYMALTRLVGSYDKPQTSFFYVGLVGCVVMTAGLPFFWLSMDSGHIWLLLLLCLTSVVGHFLMIKALSLAPLTVIQPFNYLQLVWSVILGFMVFKDMPDTFTIFGAIMVVLSGLFVFYREQVRTARIQ